MCFSSQGVIGVDVTEGKLSDRSSVSKDVLDIMELENAEKVRFLTHVMKSSIVCDDGDEGRRSLDGVRWGGLCRLVFGEGKFCGEELTEEWLTE